LGSTVVLYDRWNIHPIIIDVMVPREGDLMLGNEIVPLAEGPTAVSWREWYEAAPSLACQHHTSVQCSQETVRANVPRTSGLSLIELMVVMGIVVALCACALPLTTGVFYMYRLRAASTTAALAIESTRYHAIMQSYPYQITFSATTNSYQVLSEVPPANTFSNVGGAIPIDPGGTSAVSATTTFQFSPGGIVTLVGGTMPAVFTITNRGGTKSITVSSVGNVKVTP
jgi:Tfp pilus assembly protein FimT